MDFLKRIFPFVKEPLRLLILAVISFLIIELTGRPEEWAVILTLALRVLDKWVHDIGKELDSNQLTKSITRI